MYANVRLSEVLELWTFTLGCQLGYGCLGVHVREVLDEWVLVRRYGCLRV